MHPRQYIIVGKITPSTLSLLFKIEGKNSLSLSTMDKDAKTNQDLRCVVCDSKENLKRCTRCKGVVYCCRQHQIQDWPSHKVACTPTQRTEPKKKVGEVTTDTCESNKNNASKSEISPYDVTGNNTDVTEFDARPFRDVIFKKPRSYDVDSLAEFVIRYLNKNNFCVVDGVFSNKNLQKVLNEIKSLNSNGYLKVGRLSGGRTSGQDALKMTKTEVRNDTIYWAEGTESRHPNVNKVVQKMDTLLSALNSHLQGKYCINGRTKVM